MTWRDLLHIQIKGWGIDVHVGGGLIGALIGLAIGAELLRKGTRPWKLTKANFTFAGLGQIEICPDNEVAKIAHNAWVELCSRKAAIPFDPEHDVIVEVYNSWYELFRALRDLAKAIPPESVRASGDAPVLAEVLMKALNDGLRPHLTKWQARFRRWYDTSLTEPRFASMTPQETQRQFPDYEELLADLHKVNSGIIQFTEELRRIAHDRQRQRIRLPFRKSKGHIKRVSLQDPA
ncbi:hypothetical protein [Micromonospora sp. CB01531]|uniref:hypothetical protein n=1 Tax=Micromonospora sp. CB01531 TaxID=1718947 RepID=UPI000A86BE64|nr:hypothetical protein [Micromonospora sp. CB01531]